VAAGTGSLGLRHYHSNDERIAISEEARLVPLPKSSVVFCDEQGAIWSGPENASACGIPF